MNTKQTLPVEQCLLCMNTTKEGEELDGNYGEVLCPSCFDNIRNMNQREREDIVHDILIEEKDKAYHESVRDSILAL